MRSVFKRKSVRGFTLIEILVVVAIIALLIAILLPSLRNAREQAKAMACATQLDQMFNGILLYSNQNQERLPFFGWMDGRMNTTPRQWWVTQLARYVGNQFSLYACPTDLRPYQVNVVFNKGQIQMALSGERSVKLDVSYRGACDLLEAFGRKGYYRGRKITSFKRPARSVVLLEAGAQGAGTGSVPDRECFRFEDHLATIVTPSIPSYHATKNFTPAAKYTVRYPDWQRHIGKSNILFMDGHVQRVTPLQAALMVRWEELEDKNLARQEAQVP